MVFANAGIAASPGFFAPGGQTVDAIGPETLDSVMAMTFGNTNAATIMIAERAADLIRGRSAAGEKRADAEVR